MVYKSSRDVTKFIFYFLLFLTSAFIFGMTIYYVVQFSDSWDDYLDYAMALLSLGLLVMIVACYVRTYYKLDDDKNILYIKNGLFVEEIPYKKITIAEPEKHIVGMMSLSTKTVTLVYEKMVKSVIKDEVIYISPSKREEFLVELKLRAKNIRPMKK